MRTTTLLLPAITLALAAPDFLSDFHPAQLQQSPAQINDTVGEDSAALQLLKRQTDPNSCADGYNACTNINQPGLCCRNDQVCSADNAGHPACCPIGSACTGTIAPITQASPTGTNTQSSSSATAATTTTTSGGSATTSNTFVQGTTAPNAGTQRSTVSNTYFPFAYIPTTYTNAAACSSAYTSCQEDAASCTAALARGQNGVTISAPNGGVTITAVPSVGDASASSICSSLSASACFGLQVEACASFGPGDSAAGRRCADAWRMGAGVALGVAGQLLR
ncbi:hypothetical protein N0V90_006539 [Kalmusia sp. IMI 367209]|nr:hypothetical protein N0V90_006539 [Kalmusia sp. IMI 367209]